MRRLVTLLALALLPTAAAAQRAEDACTYDTCALRVERTWFGTRLVRGATGEKVASFGLFGPDVARYVAASDSAVPYARIYRRDHATGVTLALLGATVSLVPLFRVDQDDWFDDLYSDENLAFVLGGMALSLVGTHFELRAQRALSRAVWWYNRDLARP